jgi:hypothetical protein
MIWTRARTPARLSSTRDRCLTNAGTAEEAGADRPGLRCVGLGALTSRDGSPSELLHPAMNRWRSHAS